MFRYPTYWSAGHRYPAAILASLAVWALAVAPRAVQGQSSAPVCARSACSIRLNPVATLVHGRGPGFLPNGSIPLFRDSDGRFLTTTAKRDEVVAFSPDGKFLKAFGSLKSITGFLPLSTGTAALFDRVDRALYEVLPTLSVGPQKPYPFRPHFQLADGNFFAAALLRDPASAGYPMHVLGSDGVILRSFGAGVIPYRADEGYLHQRRVALLHDGSVLAVSAGRYILERWDPRTGRKLAEARAQQPFFFDLSGLKPDIAKRPMPLIEALWSDDVEGVAWVLVRIADESWRTPSSLAERPYDPVEHARTFDWLVQAVDYRSGTVLAEMRSRDAVWPAGPGPFVAQADLAGTYSIARLTLVVR